MDYTSYSFYVADILLASLALFYLFAASVFDIQTKEIPDWLSFSFVVITLGIRLLYSLLYGKWNFFGYGIAGCVAAFSLGAVLYYSRQLGGGDAKLAAGIGAAFGTAPFFVKSQVPFLIVVLLNILVVGAVYGMLWALFLSVKNYRKVWKSFSEIVRHNIWIYSACAVLIAALSVVMLVLGGYFEQLVWVVAVLAFVGTFFSAFMRAVEKTSMFRKVHPSRLVEGDWIAEPVKIKGKVVCGPKDAGITKEQIDVLLKNKVKNVLVKEGIPFAPSFFLAVAFAFVLGDAILFYLISV